MVLVVRSNLRNFVTLPAYTCTCILGVFGTVLTGVIHVVYMSDTCCIHVVYMSYTCCIRVVYTLYILSKMYTKCMQSVYNMYNTCIKHV